jgi:hypothetical protein
VCPTCGQCLNSGFTPEGFDELFARNEAARVRGEEHEKALAKSRRTDSVIAAVTCIVIALVAALPFVLRALGWKK